MLYGFKPKQSGFLPGVLKLAIWPRNGYAIQSLGAVKLDIHTKMKEVLVRFQTSLFKKDL